MHLVLTWCRDDVHLSMREFLLFVILEILYNTSECHKIATTISPWIVTFDALNEFKTENHEQDPRPLPYLYHEDSFNFDINLEVQYKPSQLSESKSTCKSNFKYLYWTLKQMLAHHTVTGCNLNPGDLFGTGTISGPKEGTYGSMMELSWKGTKPIQFEDNITRTYIEDGDEVIMRGFCQDVGYRVGFDDCSGLVLPSKMYPICKFNVL